MKIEAQNLINYHCPRWNELPEIELYIDQVICVLQNNLAIFLKEENTPVITPNMINNYVKQEVLMPPIKKKYSNDPIPPSVIWRINAKIKELAPIEFRNLTLSDSF